MKKRIISALLASTLLGTTGAVALAAASMTDYTASAVTTVAGFYNAVGDEVLDANLISRFSIGDSDEDGGLIEIVTYNTTAKVAYAVAGSVGQLVTIPMSEVTDAGLAGTGVNMEELVGDISGFVYGDMSSIAINSDNTKLAVALQAAGYNDDGKVAIFDVNPDGSLAENPVFVDCGKQPDALTFTPDGSKILVANEGEPREGYSATGTDGVVDPEGSVTIIDVATGVPTTASFVGVNYDDKVLLKNGSTPEQDFEPEYIAADNTTAYVALQENNAIAVLDIASGTFTGVYGLGLQNFGEVALDLLNDGQIELTTQNNVYGLYMPDGISMATINGETYLFTANEGDGREWGEEGEATFYCNEEKSKTSPTGGVVLDEKVTWFNPEDYVGILDQDKAYLYGARSFSIWQVTANGLTQVYDSGSGFEEITAETVPDNFNCSNDDKELDDRSGKKGCEPEYVAVGTVGEKTYAFIGLERLGGVMIYDVTTPATATFVNYINSRDYSDDIAGDVAPEGLCFVNAADSATGEAMLLAANEVSGTLAVIEVSTMQAEVTPAPTTAPTATPVPTQAPAATSAPTAAPVATVAPTQAPAATSAPTAVPAVVAPQTGENYVMMAIALGLLVASSAVVPFMLKEYK